MDNPWVRIIAVVTIAILAGFTVYHVHPGSKADRETLFCPGNKVLVKEYNPASGQLFFIACLKVEETHYGAQQKKTEVTQ